MHFRNTSDDNVLSDILDLLNGIKMPYVLNCCTLYWSRQCMDLIKDGRVQVPDEQVRVRVQQKWKSPDSGGDSHKEFQSYGVLRLGVYVLL